QQVRRLPELRTREARPRGAARRSRGHARVSKHPNPCTEIRSVINNPADRSRRKFVTDVGLAAAGFAIVPRHVLGRGFEAPSDTLNIASVGVGGMGRSNMINLASQNIVALCDVDWGYADRGFAQLAGEIASLQKRVDENMVEFRPPASARNQGDAPVQKRPMTALERSRTTAQIEHIKRVKDVHLARAKRYQDYREM